MKSQTQWLRFGIVALVLVAVVALVAACGGTTETTQAPATTAASDTTASTAPASTETTAAPGTATTVGLGDYKGADTEFVTGLPEPTVEPGKTFTVGFLLNNGAVGTLVAIEKAAQAQVESMGGKFIGYDAATDAQKQVSQMDQLISQKVDAIIAYSVTDATLTQGIQSAAKAGIPVIQVEVPTNPATPLNAGAISLVTIAHDVGCYETMKYISEQTPGAKLAFMNYGLPNEAIVYIMGQAHYWAQQFNLTILPDDVSAINPSPAAASDAAQSILAKHPDANYIVAFNDVSANATAKVLSAAGNTSIKVMTPNGGDAITVPLIQDGSVTCVWSGPYVKLGQQVAIAAYDAITKQGTLPERVMVLGQLATKDNVDSVTFVK
jgi:ribose transport system substrate-binding protein